MDAGDRSSWTGLTHSKFWKWLDKLSIKAFIPVITAPQWLRQEDCSLKTSLCLYGQTMLKRGRERKKEGTSEMVMKTRTPVVTMVTTGHKQRLPSNRQEGEVGWVLEGAPKATEQPVSGDTGLWTGRTHPGDGQVGHRA